ncbi:MAG: serine--tRNA ligase [Chitinophagales bacterium]|nr:serine--tRNA ligase [Chitinophagales bacterium]MDW8418673.1 serine--tRNA ligase [Chitinophagales bacterium]
MLEIAYLRAHPDEVKARLAKKHFPELHLVDEILTADEKRRQIQKQLDNNLAEQNKLAKEIGELFKQGRRQEAEERKSATAQLKEQSRQLEQQLTEVEQEQQNLLVRLPNLPHRLVPEGRSAEDNLVVKQHGKLPELPQGAKPHWELAEQYGLFSLELGVKITGAGFPVYMGKGARLQRALVAFFLDRALEAGYREVVPPYLVNSATAFGTGQLPDKEGQMYHVTEDDFYLIPTAEVPVTNIVRDDILDEKSLPLKFVAYSPCFRREAGSYGKDVRGLNRVHQFEKVEIVQIAHPDKSYDTLDEMVTHVEQLLQALELPYRIVRLCGGDMSFASALTYDFEVYSAAQQRWLEVSSVSNFETFQSNRMKTRFRDENKKIRLVHTLNGSALALPRIVAALLENHQTPEGIRIPAALQPYSGFQIITGNTP